jgi:hypothetical protein
LADDFQGFRAERWGSTIDEGASFHTRAPIDPA